MEPQLKNKAKCLRCEGIIESESLHDMQQCECGAIFIDGGKDYWRYGGDMTYFERIREEVIQNAPKARRTRGKGRKTRAQKLLEEMQATRLADMLNTDYFE